MGLVYMYASRSLATRHGRRAASFRRLDSSLVLRIDVSKASTVSTLVVRASHVASWLCSFVFEASGGNQVLFSCSVPWVGLSDVPSFQVNRSILVVERRMVPSGRALFVFGKALDFQNL